MDNSPHRIPAIFHMEGICGPFIQEAVSLPSGMARGAGFHPELEEEIDSPSFLRCHRSFLVNLAHVATIHKNDFVMENGQRVPISAAKAQLCRQKLLEWVLEQGWGRS